jgi:prephenate dehydrogenase
MNVLVVGAGEMGTWFGGCLGASVAYTDRDRDSAKWAASATDGRVVALDTHERFDAVCLAVPISAIEDAIATHIDRADRAILDVTGIMDPAVTTMREHGPDHERVSLHPLFSARHAPGRVAVVPDAPGPVTDEIRADLAACGNDLFETTTEEHDRSMATVQARTHAAVLAFGLARDEVREEFHTPVSKQLCSLVERVASGNPRVYSEIQSTFGGTEDVAEAAARLADADEETFEALYREAR